MAASPAPVRAPTTTPPAREPAAPTRLRVPAMDLDAPVVPVGVAADGQMEVPGRISEIGWYRFGAAPGSPAGSAVLAGHVDDRVQGKGAFADLGALRPGDEVGVGTGDGVGTGNGVVTYRVREVRSFAKEALPVDDLFRETGPPRLVLVTCDGPFDRAARSYRDNLVVVADPVPGAR
ncbi:hypothetical protein GCM10023200_53280 [Actinomycetospora chlora]|uniref:Class F sortase n=1 Tax=Actinomycetospora chlora TaxID=663608 RepID=A0ABP9CEK0_9PSEU